MYIQARHYSQQKPVKNHIGQFFRRLKVFLTSQTKQRTCKFFFFLGNFWKQRPLIYGILVNNKPQMPVVCNVLLQGTPCQFHSPQHLFFEELNEHEVSTL